MITEIILALCKYSPIQTTTKTGIIVNEVYSIEIEV
jgi:hypothetical protein